MNRLPSWLLPTRHDRRGRRFVTAIGLGNGGVALGGWTVALGVLTAAGVHTKVSALGPVGAIGLGFALVAMTLRRVGLWVSSERLTIIGFGGLWSSSLAISDVAAVTVAESRWVRPAMLAFQLTDGRVVRALAVCVPATARSASLNEIGEEVGQLLAGARLRTAATAT